MWLEKEEKAQAAIGEIARRLRTNIQAHALIEELAAGLKKEWHGAVMEILVESKTDALAVFPLASLLKGMQNSSTGTVYQEVQKALKQILDRRVSSIAPDNLYIVAHLEDGRYEEMSNENPFEDGYIRYGRTVSHSYLREIAREELTRRGLKW